MLALHYFLAAVPPEIGGLPTWGFNLLSVGGLVSFILMGLATSRLWTKSQVDKLNEQHEREVTNLTKQHDREVEDLKTRYELHLTRTVELYKGRVDDAIAREREWRDVSRQWEGVANMLSQGLEPLQDQSEAMLRIVTAWQTESQRRVIGQ
jgi:transposase